MRATFSFENRHLAYYFSSQIEKERNKSNWERKKAECRFSHLKLAGVNAALRWLFLLDGFEQAVNSVDKNLKKSTGTLLDHRKPLNMCGFLQTQSIVTAMKNVRLIELLASDAVRWQEDEYVQQQYHINH